MHKPIGNGVRTKLFIFDDSILIYLSHSFMRMYVHGCVGGSEQKSAGYGNDVWEDEDDSFGARRRSSSTTRTSRRVSGSNMSSMRRWLSQNTDVDVQDQEDVLNDDPIMSDDEGAEQEHGRLSTSTTTTPLAHHRSTTTMSNSKSKKGSIYDDDDGLDDLEAFGSSSLWERSGATGI